MNKKIDIPAIHDKDLRKVLEDLNLLEKLEKNELYCTLCNKVITWENLYAMKVVDNNIVLFCDDQDCIENSIG